MLSRLHCTALCLPSFLVTAGRQQGDNFRSRCAACRLTLCTMRYPMMLGHDAPCCRAQAQPLVDRVQMGTMKDSQMQELFAS